ncbi:Hypothetical predicted protein [Pelobates cultripes]|uniref:Uncharacterized protein n=1 Tax=Pelobates cultripes TaxID=61616 RepID=A0AAD1VYZ1_PELCU|nr:Hypothetical predicted protein [Pelobates cultripes]
MTSSRTPLRMEAFQILAMLLTLCMSTFAAPLTPDSQNIPGYTDSPEKDLELNSSTEQVIVQTSQSNGRDQQELQQNQQQSLKTTNLTKILNIGLCLPCIMKKLPRV